MALIKTLIGFVSLGRFSRVMVILLDFQRTASYNKQVTLVATTRLTLD
jgi:hypothetical protein